MSNCKISWQPKACISRLKAVLTAAWQTDHANDLWWIQKWESYSLSVHTCATWKWDFNSTGPPDNDKTLTEGLRSCYQRNIYILGIISWSIPSPVFASSQLPIRQSLDLINNATKHHVYAIHTMTALVHDSDCSHIQAYNSLCPLKSAKKRQLFRLNI